jgi:DNA-binding transcriptional ArsR family regulator
VQDTTLILDKPEQLKALGHPLRVRVLEMLGQEGDWQLTNRELAQRLGVDPGHLHFHVRMLLKAGLIELADANGRGRGRGRGREKPYRAVAKVFRIAPELLAAGGASDIQAAMIDQVQRAHGLYSGDGTFRSAQLEVKLSIEAAVMLMGEFLDSARNNEDDDADKIVLTVFGHPPANKD